MLCLNRVSFLTYTTVIAYLYGELHVLYAEG